MHSVVAKVLFALLIWAVACVGPSAMAAEQSAPEPEGKEKAEKALNLDDVVVRGETTRDTLKATSATVLDHDQITDRIYVTPLDMLKLSPGISIAQYNQGGTAASFQMRGFRSCSHGSDAALFLDGVPLNETDGYADTNIVIPDEIERVEIIKGPSSALYGNYASAGVVHFVTIKKGDFTRLRLRGGSFNTQDAVFTMARKDGKLDHVYAGQIYHTDGYQDNSDWNKQNVAGRWSYQFTDKLEASFGMRAFNSDWDAPGYIPQAVYDSRPESAVSDVNGGKKKRLDGRVDVRYRLTQSSKLLGYVWSYDQTFNRYYQNWISESQTPGSNYGNEREFRRKVMGAGMSYNYLGSLAGNDASVILGLDFMREDDHRRRWNLVVGNGRHRGSQYEDYDLELNSMGLYGEAEYQVLRPLKLVLGARWDRFYGSLDDTIASSSWDLDDKDIFSPKAGLIYTIVQDWQIFANFGRGFALPTGMNLFKNNQLNPAIRTQYELGFRAKPVKMVDVEFTLFTLNTTDDIQSKMDDPSELENAGETKRTGCELGINIYPLKHLYFHADYSYTDATYEKYNSGGVSYDDKQIQGIPKTIVNAEVGYRPPVGLGGRLTYRYSGERYIDAANTMEWGGDHLVDGQVSYRFNDRYELMLDVINLFDTKYTTYSSYTNGVRTYTPGDPLSCYLTLKMSL